MARARRAASAPATKKTGPTEYVVQRMFTIEDVAQPETGDQRVMPDWLPSEIWYDIGPFKANAPVQAMKAASQVSGSVKAGSYRAFPARSDSRLDVATKVETIALFTVPVSNNSGAAAPQEEE